MLWWLAENTAFACLLAVFVAAVCRLVNPRPAIRHAMWLVVLVKLIAPPVPYVSWPLPDREWLAKSRSDDIVKPGALAPGSELTNTDPSSERATSLARETDVAPVGLDIDDVAQVPGANAPGFTMSPAAGFAQGRHPLDKPGATAGLSSSARSEISNTIEAVETRPIEIVEHEPPSVVIESIEYLPIETLADESAVEAPSTDTNEAIATAPYTTLLSLLDSEQGNRIAGYLWLFLTLGMAVFEAGRVIRFRRMVNRARPASPWLARQVEQAARQMNIRAPEVLVTSGACSPVLWTLGRPRLLWPDRLTARLSAAAIRGVIVHELAHLARRDHWVRRLELAAGCGWWWHPLFWIVRRQLHEHAELACDAWVVSAFPGARRAYAQALIEVIDFSQQSTLPASALGAGGATRRTFERRLRMIMRERVPSRVSLAAATLLLLVCVAVLPGWSRGQDGDANSDDAVSDFDLPASGAAIEDEPAGVDTGDDFQRGRIFNKSFVGSLPAGADDGHDSSFDASAGSVIAPASRLLVSDASSDATLANTGATLPGPTATTADRIKRMERQLEQLMNEVKAMRTQSEGRKNPYTSTASKPRTAQSRPANAASAYGDSSLSPYGPARGASPSSTGTAESSRRRGRSAIPYGRTAGAPNGGTVLLGGRLSAYGSSEGADNPYRALGATDVRMLTRVTYRLPAPHPPSGSKAQALASFLDEHAGERVETKVKGNSLVVTASEEDQQVVGRFIVLIAAAAKDQTPPVLSSPLDPASFQPGDRPAADDGAVLPTKREARGYDDLLGGPDDSAPAEPTLDLSDDPITDPPNEPQDVPFDDPLTLPLDAEPTPADEGDSLDSDPFGASGR